MGWEHPELPSPGTPLEVSRPLLAPRLFNLLARERFSSTEEVAVVPDAVLMEIRHMGQPSIDALRAAIATAATAAT